MSPDQRGVQPYPLSHELPPSPEPNNLPNPHLSSGLSLLYQGHGNDAAAGTGALLFNSSLYATLLLGKTYPNTCFR